MIHLKSFNQVKLDFRTYAHRMFSAFVDTNQKTSYQITFKFFTSFETVNHPK